jgi:hypothetical protein
MSNDNDQNNTDRPAGGEDKVDEIATSAGAALRRPAPADGMARIRSSQRRRRATRAVAGGSAVVIMVVGLFLIVGRGSDDATMVTDTGPDTTSPGTAPPDTVSTESTTAGSASPTTTDTTEPSTTTPSNESGWQPATEQFPALAFIACCGTDWEGEPSPAVPTDPAAPLPPGTYNLRPAAHDEADDQQTTDAVVDGVLTLEVRPYARCNELGEFECSGGGPYDDTALGVPTDAARTIDLVLDDSVGVGVSGFACEDDRLLPDPQVSIGTDLAALFVELDASYESAVGEPLRGGVDPMQLADDLAANPTSGFFDPGCPSYSSIAWTPTSGPTILASTLYRLDAASVPEPLPSAAASWITPTALVVDQNGDNTVYFYAGFLS